jgi:hypothetical protein
MATIFDDALNQKITIRDNGKTRKITVWEGIVRTLTHEAMKGNLKAVELLLAKEPEIARKTEPLEMITDDMSALEAVRVYQRLIARDDWDPTD